MYKCSWVCYDAVRTQILFQNAIPALGSREDWALQLVCKVILLSASAMKNLKCQIHAYRSGGEIVVKYPVIAAIKRG